MEKSSWEKLPAEQLNHLISRQMLNGENATVARLLLKRGAIVPRHSHVSEQFSLIWTAGCGSYLTIRRSW